MENNNHFKFSGQTSNERILYFSRRHWVYFTYLMIRNNLLGAVAGLAIASLWYFFLKGTNALDVNTLATVQSLLGILILMIVFCTSLLTWTIWYLTVTVLTQSRLVKIVQKGLFYHYVHDIKLNRLQDLTYTYAHPIQYIFNYGRILAHVASGETGKFEINYLPNPRDLHHYIHKVTSLVENSPNPEQVEIPPYEERGFWAKKGTQQEKVGMKYDENKLD